MRPGNYSPESKQIKSASGKRRVYYQANNSCPRGNKSGRPKKRLNKEHLMWHKVESKFVLLNYQRGTTLAGIAGMKRLADGTLMPVEPKR